MNKTEKNKYIKKLYSAIEKVAQAHGYNLIAPIIAHAVICSEWGESPLAAHNNIFGLKCCAKWTGDVVNHDTMKIYKPKKRTVIEKDYRAYETLSQCIESYFVYLDSYMPRLKYAKNYKSFCKMIENYTNKRNYAIMLLELIEEFNLEKYN